MEFFFPDKRGQAVHLNLLCWFKDWRKNGKLGTYYYFNVRLTSLSPCKAATHRFRETISIYLAAVEGKNKEQNKMTQETAK